MVSEIRKEIINYLYYEGKATSREIAESIMSEVNDDTINRVSCILYNLRKIYGFITPVKKKSDGKGWAYVYELTKHGRKYANYILG